MNVHAIAQAEKAEGFSGNGTVRATALVVIVDFNGNTRERRLQVAREYCVGRETAKNMAKQIRVVNPTIAMRVTYTEEM